MMMAWEIPVLDISLVAADDLQDFQYFFVKVNSDGEVELAGDGEAALGVLQNKPGEATGAGGEAASIRIYGVSKVVAAEAIDPGEEVASDADGKAKVADSGDRVLGVALTAAANEDEIISIALYHGPELA